MFSFSRASLRFRVNGAIVLTSLLIAVLFALLLIPFLNQQLSRDYNKATTLLYVLTEGARDHLANEIFENRMDAVNLRLTRIMEIPGVVRVRVYDTGGTLLASRGSGEDPPPEDRLDVSGLDRVSFEKEGGASGFIVYMSPVSAMGETMGHLLVTYSLKDVEEDRRNAILMFAGLLFCIFLILILFLNLLLSQVIIRPIAQAGETMATIARGHLDSRVPDSVDDELGRLGMSVNRMADRVQRQQSVLREAEERYRSLFENAVEGVFQADSEGFITTANPFFARIFGYDSPKALVESGMDIATRIQASPEEREELSRKLQEGGEVSAFKVRLSRPDGSVFWGNLSMRAVADASGRLVGHEGFLVDITERLNRERAQREQKEAEASARAKGEFLANMSHEIRTPMNAIIGMSHLALATGLDSRPREYVSAIHRAGLSLLAIVDSILDFSRIDAGKANIQEAPFVLDEALSRVGSILALQAGEKGLEFFFRIRPDVPLGLVGDSGRLEQILINLAGNAVKFTERGEVAIEVDRVSEKDGRVFLRFAVRDTGIGVSPAQADRLFMPFTQGDQATTRKHGGTGLGLSICSRLANLLGGTLEVGGEVGRGSVFSLTLPLGLAPGDWVEPPGHLDWQGKRVLVAAKNKALGEALAEMASYLGFLPFAAESMAGARAILNREKDEEWAFLLLDRALEDVDSRAPLPAPAILLGFLQEADRAGVSGPDLALEKPATRLSLARAARRVLGLEEREETSTPLVAENEEQARNLLEGRRVLLVEDNMVNRQLALGLLERVGIQADVAVNGAEAVAAVDSRTYDLVLMDVQMPEMDGLAATAAIRADPRHRDLPILAMTAHAMSGDAEKSQAAGMNEHLAKPVEPGRLYEALLRWIRPAPPGASRETEGETPTPPRSKTGPRDLPPLPGLDVALGIRQMGGDPNRYRTCLTIFSQEHAGNPGAIRQALETRDARRLAELSHDLKGVAGLLGARRLFRAAVEVNDSLRKKQVDQGLVHCEELVSALEEVLESLAGLEDSQKPPGESAEPGDLAGLLGRLARCLRDHDSLAEDLAAEALALLAGGVAGEEGETLVRQVEEVEYGDAQKTLETITQKLGLAP
ncbi:MAG: ATP-binding protein [Pseudomonadota bacterium]